MYKTDEKGEYRVPERWIRAWGGTCAGFTINELREYSDGTHRVWVSEAAYIHEHPEFMLAHKIYRLAEADLGN